MATVSHVNRRAINPADPHLLEATPEELMELFKTLPAPTIAEMDGEFNAQMLTQKNIVVDLAWRAAVYTPFWPGIWIGKAFRPISETEGRGYNYFRQGDKIVQSFAMKNVIAPSKYDAKPAFQLVYRAYHSACGMVNMVDEVRRLGDGRYLLIGTAGFTQKQRQFDSFFLLEKTERPYRGDIGKPRAKWSLEKEIPNLHNPA